MQNIWLNLMNLFERILLSTEIAYHLKHTHTKTFNKVIEEKTSEFWSLQKNNQL